MVTENHNHAHSLRWLVLLTVIVGTFLGRLDQTVVNLALPKIIDSFDITVSQSGWIITAYILANAIFVPIWGKLGDTIGRKKVYIMGFTIFIIGSVLAGLSWNLWSMIVFRIIQAVASSADYPTAMAIISVTFRQGRERAQALGVWSSAFAAAAVFGPLIGGPLIDNFGWRSVFLLNLPVGLVGLFMALTFIRESVAQKKSVHFDWWGAITLGLSLSALVLVLDRGVAWGWLSLKSYLCYLSAVAFTMIFIYIESQSPEPIVDLKFFKNKVFNNTLMNNFVVFMGLMGSIFLVPIFAQTFLGYNATETGYLFIPMAFFLVIASPLGGSLTGKVQPRYVIFVSTLIASLGLYLFHFIDPRSGLLDLVIPLSVLAFGLGLGMPQRTNVIASVVSEHEMGVASSILALARNISGAFGIAFFSTILNNHINSSLLQIGQASRLNVFNPEYYQQFIGLIILKAQVSSYGFVFLVASVVLFFGSFLAFFIVLKEEKKDAKVMVEV